MKTSMWHGDVKVTAKSGGGGPGLLRIVIALVVLLVAGSAGYRVLSSALLGVQESVHEANVIAAWLVGGSFGLALVIAATAFLLYQRREARQAPVARAITEQVDAQLAARQQSRAVAAHQPVRAVAARPAIPLPPAVGARWDRRPVDLDALERGERRG